MDRWGLLFAAFAAVAVAVTAQDMDYYGDGLWSSDEIPLDELVAPKEDLDKVKDYAFYGDDTPDEPELDVMLNEKLENIFNGNTGDKVSDQNLIEDGDENAKISKNYNYGSFSNEDEFDNKDWEQIRREQKPDSEVKENFDDYQVEDNRSDTKIELVPLEKLSDFPQNEDTDPSDDVNDELNYPEFAANNKNEESSDDDQILAESKKLLEEENSDFEEDIEDKKLFNGHSDSSDDVNDELNYPEFADNNKNEKSSDNDQIVVEAMKLLEEENGDFEEDIEGKELVNGHSDPSDDVNDELNYPEFTDNNKNEESSDDDQIVAEAKKLLEDENSDFEEDIEEKDLDSTEKKSSDSNEPVLNDSDDDGPKNEFFDDIIENHLNEEIKSFVNEMDDMQSQINENNSDADDENEDAISNSEKDFDQYDNDVPVDKDEQPSNTVPKYENDMIEPEETETAKDNSKNEADTNDEVENTNGSEQEINDDDEETVDKVYEDLDADLNKLFKTWNKLISDDSEIEEDSVEEYEDKFGKPYREGNVLQQRDEFYADVDDDDIVGKSDSSNENTVENNDEDPQDSSDKLFGFKLTGYIPEDYDENMKLEVAKPEQLPYDLANSDEKEDYPEDAPAAPIAVEEEDKVSNKEEYSTLTSTEVKSIEAKFENPVSDIKEDYPDSDEAVEDRNTPVKSIDIDDLNEQQYTELMKRFDIEHKSETEELKRDIAPIHMTLVNNETIEITSPYYPSNYPTNNIVDWIIEGDGEGIELNITDLELRGLQGDYLLVRPGGINEDSKGGLLFSYHLNQPNLRHYRFTDVSRLFVRFNAGTGLNFLKGFRMTVKMIWPSTPLEEGDLPMPEALLPPPPATMTVTLGGLMYPYFKEVQESFRRVVADMAIMYINANSIDGGLNSTSETAQITNVASCNINWPNFLECVQVTFGVPLVYEDEVPEENARLNQDDLTKMWTTYANQDPFAARLRMMGITEFDGPNDNHVMLAWVVLACGAVIAAAMLGLALWRYSCFQDYTRMKNYGDTDSLREEKRRHDLYPTPHQPLPALYADNDYKWAEAKYDDSTRVDLGGFTNKSYARDELLEIDSDEEAVTPRDGYTTDV